jgi:hypothetical protein
MFYFVFVYVVVFDSFTIYDMDVMSITCLVHVYNCFTFMTLCSCFHSILQTHGDNLTKVQILLLRSAH